MASEEDGETDDRDVGDDGPRLEDPVASLRPERRSDIDGTD
jgi:hypothetical protein